MSHSWCGRGTSNASRRVQAMLLAAALAAIPLRAGTAPAIRSVESELVHDSQPVLAKLRGPLSSNALVKFDAEQRLLQERRAGHYLTVLWDAGPGRPGPCLVRLSFTQERSRVPSQLEVRFDNPAGPRNEARFAVVGPRFEAAGPIRSWQAELWVGDRMVDSRSSPQPPQPEPPQAQTAPLPAPANAKP